jgi:TetR/AcrR family transcriptional regulator, regulator of biofilm formation and stress response
MAGGARSEQVAHDSVRRRILEATLQVIAAEGIDAVRHRRVADMAGVSLGSTTYHFAGRDDLIEAAFGLYLDEAAAFLDGIRPPSARAGDVTAAIVGYIDRLLSQEFEEEGMVQAEYELILYAARTPRMAERLQEWEATQRAHFEQVLRDAGSPRPAEAARTLLAMVRGLEVERLTSGASIRNLRHRLEPVVRALVEG